MFVGPSIAPKLWTCIFEQCTLSSDWSTGQHMVVLRLNLDLVDPDLANQFILVARPKE